MCDGVGACDGGAANHVSVVYAARVVMPGPLRASLLVVYWGAVAAVPGWCVAVERLQVQDCVFSACSLFVSPAFT